MENEITSVVESQPEETTAEAVAEASNEPESEMPAQGESNAEATPAEETTETDESAAEEPKPVIRVKFNKQEREYGVDEAVPLVEMGLKHEAFAPHYEKLRFLASSAGTDVPTLIDRLMKSNDNVLYQKTLEECGGNEELAKRMFEYQKSERSQKFTKLKEDEAAKEAESEQDERAKLTDRLAKEFVELGKEVPGTFAEFKDVPQPVVDMAIKKGISLFDAYLRYERAETRKAETTKAQQEKAAKASAGSMSGDPINVDPSMEEFERSFRMALR